ncbi:peptidase domain-containing ABC transporter [Parahaliea sp. F7430]|uniref:Peptidase domain-containing ABC transporter n=1 Tax=Sediminihaliea albiluteola TaxID=2758564 RepID=A0A7W2TVQ0_9GAMM|nr:peptidase domain-containing ABC transporter [Sediminihaliea albiluteola]MBA6412845.1 peptidase domain-containing ABC transporter [Sediminihaliea albiluteola]
MATASVAKVTWEQGEKRLRGRLPVLLQSEVAECGLTCLAMIASYHGYITDNHQMRRCFSISNQGVTLKSLINIAAALKLDSRAVRLEVEALKHLATPCILHWDMNHFVVLKSVGRKTIIVHDPATGRRSYSVQDLAKHFTGVALELWPAADFKPAKKTQKLPLRSFWQGLPGIAKSFAQILFCSIVLQLFLLLSPLYMQIVVDDVVLREDWNLLLVVALAFALLLLIEMAVSLLRQLILIRLASRMNLNLATALFHHLLRLPLEFFDKRHIGDLVSRFGSLDAVRQTLSTGLVGAIVDGVLAISTLAAMYWYNAQLASLTLASLVLYIVFRTVLYRPLRLLSEESLVAKAHKDSSFIESARAIQTIKLFGGERVRHNHWQKRLVDCINVDIDIAKLQIIYELGNRFLLSGGNILIVYFAASSVIKGSITLGMLFAFMSFKRHFISAMDTFVDQCIELKMISLHLERLADIAFVKQESHYADQGDKVELLEAQGKLEVKDLTFRYDNTTKALFDGLSFSLQAGQTLAITGPSGAGKTTLMKCLMGILSPASGEILIDNKSLNSLSNFRDISASVMQDIALLPGSIAENIACFDEQPSLERIIECSKLCYIHDEIIALPMQYNTMIGQSQTPLSSGQQQRIALARALYKRPTILFLDEATNNLDSALATKIEQTLKTMRISKVVISHQSKLIETADVVVEVG